MDNDTVYLVSYKNKTAVIQDTLQNQTYIEVTFPYEIYTYTCKNNMFYFILMDVNAAYNNVVMAAYFSAKSFDGSFKITSYSLNMPNRLCVASDNDKYLYFIDSKNTNTIIKYNLKGKLISKSRYNYPIIQVICTANNEVIAFTKYNAVKYKNDSFSQINGDYKPPPGDEVVVVGENTFYDANSNLFLYNSSKNTINVLLSKNNQYIIHNGVVAANSHYIAYNNYNLTGYKKENYQKTKSVTLPEKATNLCYFKDRIIVLFSNNDNFYFSTYYESSFKSDIVTPTSSPSSPDNTQNTNTSVTTPKSNFYNINTNAKTISKIPSKCTLSTFKKNINYTGFSLKVFKNNSEIKSGQIGTGMIAQFLNDNQIINYKTIVKGDISGEGNINTLDTNKIFDVLLKIQTLEGVYFTAADMNNDNIITTKDLLLVSKNAQ